MLVFVDESGDAGMKLERASSSHFVVTAVMFEEYDEAAACDQRIGLLRRELNLPPEVEFHFNKSSRRVREGFLRGVAPYQFFYISAVVNKALLERPEVQMKQPFYSYVVSLVFQWARPHLQNASVVIDRSSSEDFQKKLARYLKRRTNVAGAVPAIRRVKSERSHNNNLLQLADMICGAVARSVRVEKGDSDVYRRLIRHRELNVREWPTPSA